MPWQVKDPTPEAVMRRIAYHIAVRIKEQGAKNIAARAGLSPDAVRDYGNYQFAPGKKGGPHRFEYLLRIVTACGDDFANVFWAAQESTDHTSFYQILSCDLIAQQSLVIEAANERRASRRLFTQAPALAPRAIDQSSELPEPAPLRAVT